MASTKAKGPSLTFIYLFRDTSFKITLYVKIPLCHCFHHQTRGLELTPTNANGQGAWRTA